MYGNGKAVEKTASIIFIVVKVYADDRRVTVCGRLNGIYKRASYIGQKICSITHLRYT